MLTSAELKQISDYLAQYGVKDSQLQQAGPITGREYVALVQNGENKIASLDTTNEYIYDKVIDYISDTSFQANAVSLGDNDYQLQLFSRVPNE